MVIPLIMRGAGMAAKGTQNIGGAVQQGWQKVPGSAKVGMMAGLAVGGAKRGYNVAMWGPRKIGGLMQKEFGAWIIIFPIILAIIDYFLGLNGIPINFIFSFDFLSDFLFKGPFWFFLLFYIILRKPRGRDEIVFTFALIFLMVLTFTVKGSNIWVLIHLAFAIITLVVFLHGFDSSVPIDGRHWTFLIVFFIDVYGLASIAKLVETNAFGIEGLELILNRVLFPLWFFYYISIIKDGTPKTVLTLLTLSFYAGYIGWESYQVYGADLQLMDQEATKDAQNAIVTVISNWRDATSKWFVGRINYAITGKVEENQYEPLGVYLENVQSDNTKYYLDENVVVWGTVKARTLDDPINIEVGCFVERDKKKFFAVEPYGKTDPAKKFSVFTLEEQDFACTFNGTRKGFVSKLKEGSNTIKTFADFNFETLSYLKVYFIDKERQRAMTREGLDIFEEFDITDKNPVAVYTNGPAKIEMGTTNPLVGVSENYPAEPSLGIDISNREGWQGSIKMLKELVIFLPDGIEFDALTSCSNKEFEEYDAVKCKVNSCANIVRKECLEVCDGYKNPDGTTNNAFKSCTESCNENFDRCKESCDSFFEEGAQKYKGYSLKPDSYEREKDIEKGIQLRCRFRPKPSILGNAPLTTKSFRVKARYQYNVEKSVSVNIQKDETSGGEGNVGAPLNLRVKGSDGAMASDGSVTLTDSITIVWDKSINDGGGSNDVAKYRVYRKDGDTGEFNKKPIGEVDAKGTASYEYADRSVVLSSNYKYSYYVDVLNKDNQFEKSGTILEITPGNVVSSGQDSGAGVPPGSVAILYEDAGYKGKALDIRGDVSDLGAVNFKAASSFRINNGYVATLYQHKDFKGECFSDVVSRPDLGKIAFESGTMNDAVSSIKVSGFKGAVLYAVKDYQGMSSYYEADDNKFNGDCERNDISSIRVAPGYQAILYRDADFNGMSPFKPTDCDHIDVRCIPKTINPDGRTEVANLDDVGLAFNDQPSSIRIVKKVS